MKKNKQILLTLGTIAATVSPVVAIVSCGATDNYIKYDPNKEIIAGSGITGKTLVDASEKEIQTDERN